MKLDFDVVVVGAGVAGAMVAERLSLAGARVLILEAGSRNPSRTQMVGSYAIAPIKGLLHNPYLNAESDAKAPSPDSSRSYYDQPPAPHTQYESTYERRTGGSTWHWLGHTPRMLVSDFLMKTRYGDGPNFPPAMVDWPIRYDDLEPWYCEAETEMGVSGSDEEWKEVFGTKRSKPFPMSMIWPSYSDNWIAARINGKKFDGAEYLVRSTPAARNSTFYDGRPPCAGNSICVPLCPIGAKYDGSVHVGKALQAGAVLWEQCVVSKLEKDADDDSVHTVQFITYGGEHRSVAAAIVVVAAHAIETPKLLLMSGLANSSDQVGRNLMDHLSKSAFGVVGESLFPFRGPPSTSGIESFRDGEFRKERAGFRVSLDNDGWSRLNSPYAEILDLVGNQKLIGAELQSALFERVSRQVRLSCSVEVAPVSSNRVELSTATDALGLPHPKITFTPPEYSYKGLAHAVKTLADMFRLMDATNIQPIDPKTYDGAGHIMGTCRMGENPKSSVVDSDGRTHDHGNLFIVGSSVFPTVGSPNPTLTLAALALRTAQRISVQLGARTKPRGKS
jgi:choline dehydrogenase-like flavoprotein